MTLGCTGGLGAGVGLSQQGRGEAVAATTSSLRSPTTLRKNSASTLGISWMCNIIPDGEESSSGWCSFRWLMAEWWRACWGRSSVFQWKWRRRSKSKGVCRQRDVQKTHTTSKPTWVSWNQNYLTSSWKWCDEKKPLYSHEITKSPSSNVVRMPKQLAVIPLLSGKTILANHKAEKMIRKLTIKNENRMDFSMPSFTHDNKFNTTGQIASCVSECTTTYTLINC